MPDINCCPGPNNFQEVPFCCVQVVPKTLEINTNKLRAENIEITFTPRLQCCIDQEILSCTVEGANCNIAAAVLKLLGCIEYALSTIDNSDPVAGDFGAKFAAVSCCGCVCVDQVICCHEDGLECPENLEEKFAENPITAELDDAQIEECSAEAHTPDKKIIKFTGRFLLPDICAPGPPPPVECPEIANLETFNPSNGVNRYTIEIAGFNGSWCYDVTVEPDSQDLSHWVLELCPDIKEEDISNITRNGIPVPVTDIDFGTDPRTGVTGIKFDISQSVAEGTVRYCFDLEGEFGLTAVDVGVFAANDEDVELICGPECL